MSTHFKMAPDEEFPETTEQSLARICDNMRILLEEDIEPKIRGEGRNFFDIVSDQIAVLRGRIKTLENED